MKKFEKDRFTYAIAEIACICFRILQEKYFSVKTVFHVVKRNGDPRCRQRRIPSTSVNLMGNPGKDSVLPSSCHLTAFQRFTKINPSFKF